MNINAIIQQFIQFAIQQELLEPIDAIYVRNRLLALIHKVDYEIDSEEELDRESHTNSKRTLLDCLDDLVNYALDEGVIENSQSDRDIFEAAVMDLITPIPSVVNRTFWHHYDESPSRATDYFYHLSQANNYIKTREIAKNIAFKGESPYGDLEITINLSKPEKDPVEIAKARLQPQVNYPKCALCIENEGYLGHMNHAARQHHRIIRMPLRNGLFGFQYSPYVYYNEHSIFLSEYHTPMVIDRVCFENLFDIVDYFPEYFVGSNADLPGVGGSILTHDHYQGGHHVFPMDLAKVNEAVTLLAYPEVHAELLNWPMSVIRLKSNHRERLLDASEHILNTWRGYSDEELDIIASTDQPHNTVTPIARRKESTYELNLVLRNNRTSTDLPLGIFHPHPDVQHIKKENIGLIEVMGLAILPARLVHELQAVQDYIQESITIDEVPEIHRSWALELKEQYHHEDIESYIQRAVVRKFTRVLEDAGVYKQTAEGQAGFKRFIDAVNQLSDL